MSELNVALAAVGGLLLVLGLLTNLIKRAVFVLEPLLALLAGVLIGPADLGRLDLASFGDRERILEGAARLTLAVALMSVALRLPTGYLIGRGWGTVAVLLGLVMPLMWLSSSLLAYLILGLSLFTRGDANGGCKHADGPGGRELHSYGGRGGEEPT